MVPDREQRVSNPTLRPLVLLVEDELSIRVFMRTLLSSAGYQLEEAASGEDALRLARQRRPDVVILDLGLPDIEGKEILRGLRELLSAPVIVVSARDRRAEIAACFEAGAAEYLTKPVFGDELLNRLSGALRASARAADEREATTFELGDLKINLTTKRVVVNEKEIELNPLEFKLLSKLVRNAGKVVTDRQLLHEISESSKYELHHLRALMASVRRRVEKDPVLPKYLVFEQGVGYRLRIE
jgi:two-component system KDP operon response regulator KdpE